MKIILGLILIVSGIAIGLYVGAWLMFVGGIIDIVSFIKQDLSNSVLGWGVIKILFAGVVGQLCAMVFIIPGYALFD